MTLTIIPSLPTNVLVEGTPVIGLVERIAVGAGTLNKVFDGWAGCEHRVWVLASGAVNLIR